MARKTITPVLDDETLQDNPVEFKYRKLERAQYRDPEHDRTLMPNSDEKRILDVCVSW